MPSAKEGRYQAYKLLRELDAQIAVTMNQVAYGRMSRVDWEKTCKAHRIAFDEWIKFADLQTCEEIDSAAKKPDDV
ncbi:hypothetical protein [Pseudomonas mosselii]|uniref:hypothetical protein n=1 Tax=Pseudomonas mosselii TaxID=78327 RepID=UPI001BD61999|nr:hypothetical protein [Pseudomonas mosselii]MBS9761828.1 hypothetical protein [Pseudomonas mosselii]